GPDVRERQAQTWPADGSTRRGGGRERQILPRRSDPDRPARPAGGGDTMKTLCLQCTATRFSCIATRFSAWMTALRIPFSLRGFSPQSSLPRLGGIGAEAPERKRGKRVSLNHALKHVARQLKQWHR